ncbi:MAG: hypothetical protein HN742_40105 [Lentisphaerae bacterium]|jgi:hypothetical protein|nr:hypothetical protein [Lentisphaerota bacterium]MBT7055987.1 hypothetical protein [Lentisphaerota bacterium]MBT7848140.1 hypothetical protein [Lentisphaerota bacterium]
MTTRMLTRVIVLVAVGALVQAANAPLPDARQLREAQRRELRNMPSLIRHHTFGDLQAEGLTFVPGSGTGALEIASSRWPGAKAVRIDRGWLQAETPLDIPESGFTVAVWFRHHGMGGLTHHNGRLAYRNGSIAASGSGYREGWRLLVTPGSGSTAFSIGRPEVGSISVSDRACIQPGTWHHVAATWDHEQMRLYVDGRLRGQTAYDGPATPSVPHSPFRIGEAGFGTGTVKLDVAEVAVFSEALSPGTICRFADPAASLVDAVRACLVAGDHAVSARSGAFWRRRAKREATARASYRCILEVDTSEKPYVLGNHKAIARLRMAESYRRERRFDDARREHDMVAGDEAVPLHYRAQAMLGNGDTFRDELRYTEARATYRTMEQFFTGRHENWRVEARHRLADVEGLVDGEPFRDARRRRIDRISRPAVEFFVATNGDDANPGTRRRPFATLERAREVVRQLRGGGPLPKGGVTVNLRNGTYRRMQCFELCEQDSGTFEAPVVYQAFRAEKVTLSGGVEVSGFRPVTAKDASGRLLEASREHVVVLDLEGAGVTDFGTIHPRGYAIRPVPAHLELFFNDEPMQLARWPNAAVTIAEAYAQVKGFADGNFEPFYDKPMNMSNAFVYKDDLQDVWQHEPDAWIFGYWNRWFCARYSPLKKLEPDKNIIRMGLPGAACGRNPKKGYETGGIFKGAPYFGINLLCELDSPGEWYLDRDSGKLYFWPPSPVSRGRAVVSLLEDRMLSFDGASHIVFRGMTLEAGRGDAVWIKGGEGVLLAGCVVRNMGNSAVVIGPAPKESKRMSDPTVGGWRHGVIGCDILNMGDAGVHMTGGDEETLTPCGHFVENCHIHHINRWNRAGYQPAVFFGTVGGRASHNLIHDISHQAVRAERNDNVFEYNEVHDAPYEAREMGTFYMYGVRRVLGTCGNIARYNMFHHVPYTAALRKSFHCGGRPVFHIDHMNGAMTIYGNIFWAIESNSGGFFSGGRNNMLENNVFSECVSGIRLGDRSWVFSDRDQRGKDRFLSYLREMKVDEPPWSVRYPQLVGALARENPALPTNNLVARNIGIKTSKLLDVAPLPRETATVEHNWDVGDPGFTDPEYGDFTLRPDAPVLGTIGFDPIPVERIGLYDDELRATWPVHHEVDTHEHMSLKRKPLGELPVHRITRRKSAITIDGKLDPDEWNGLKPGEAAILAQSPGSGETSALKSHAWILRDDQFLYIGLRNPVNPDKPLAKDKNVWWLGDMVEIIIEGEIGVNTGGWWLDEAEHGPLFYLLGDFQGTFESYRIAGLPPGPAEKLQRTVQYATDSADASCWTAEWKIPFDSICLDPVNSKACCFNIGVNKTGTPIDESWSAGKKGIAGWAVLVGVDGPNWEVWNAARLSLR